MDHIGRLQKAIDDLPEGSVVLCIVQLAGRDAEIISTVDSKRDMAAGLRYMAGKLSPEGDA